MANVGLAPREVRLAILSIGLILTSVTGSTVLASTLGLIAILATLTTIQRVLHVRAQSREG
jgi:hypothetical protein